MEDLTPSQFIAYNNLEKCLEKNKIAFVCGGERVGKKYIARYYLRDKNAKEYDIMTEVGMCRDAYEVIDRLDIFVRGVRASKVTHILIINWETLYVWMVSGRFRASNYGNEFLIQFTRNLEREDFRTIIPVQRSSAQSLVGMNSWLVDVEVKDVDVKTIIQRFYDVEEEVKEAVAFTKITDIDELKTIASQATKGVVEGEKWIQRFHKVQQLVNPGALDTEKKVIEPIMSLDMLGTEDAREIIEREVITPIKMGNPAIPVCKGVLLYGPSGSGKTTTLRWLSHRLEGKIYICERGRIGSLVDSFVIKMREAAQKAPAIVFIDDIDSILDKPDAVRDLLVALDGVNIKGRENVTVIMTCMDISLVPKALHRGGRLERCIEFRYPSVDIIRKIIHNRFNKCIEEISSCNEEVSKLLADEFNSQNIRQLASSINGWSPSNVHLLVDMIIRHAIGGNSGEKNLMRVAEEEIKRIKDLERKTTQSSVEKGGSHEHIYS